jgi:hypothetical protein
MSSRGFLGVLMTVSVAVASAQGSAPARAAEGFGADVPKGTVGIVCRDGAGALLSTTEADAKPAFESCVRAALIQMQADRSSMDLTEYLNGFSDFHQIGTQLRIEHSLPIEDGAAE